MSTLTRRTGAASPLAAALRANGYLRRSRFNWEADSGHKEWLHFAIHGPGVDLLTNFSLVDDIRPGVAPGTEIARIVTLVRERGGRWTGDIDQYRRGAVRARGGDLAMSFGGNSARFEGGKFRLSVAMRRQPITIDLELSPRTFPTQANNLMVDDCPPIQWLVMPRWSARGSVQIDGNRYELENSVAYHDHNWGKFRWGKDFAWEWGYAAPEEPDNPWTMVFVRLTDRPHLTDLMQALFLWRGEHQERVFRADEITVWHEGLLRPKRVFKLPRVMALAHPSNVTDVPARLVAQAKRGADELLVTFTTNDVAQVIIPNDDDRGVTIIHEVAGDVDVSGFVGGRDVSISGPSIFEFLGE